MPQLVVLVQNLMGVGHQRRASAICEAAVKAGWQARLVSGGFPMRGFDAGVVDFVQLPPARCPDLKFDRLVTPEGLEVDDAWRKVRARATLDAVTSVAPDVVLVETFPFGRKLLRFELIPLLEHLRASTERPLVVSSVRDIIEYRPKFKKYAVMADAATTYFDAILVHSDPRLVPLERTFPAFDAIQHLVHYTGFVHHKTETGSSDAGHGDGEVLVSSGGGGYGLHVLEAALAARANSNASRLTWRVLVGENVEEADFERLRRKAIDNVVVERSRPDFQALLGRARLSISQGGYNTVMDLLTSRTPAVVVAYHDNTEREQLLRAEMLAERNWIQCVRNGELSTSTLVDAINRALTMTLPRMDIQLDGANRSIEVLSQLLEARR